MPIVELGKYINIEFDVVSDESPSMNIKFFFCDKNWRPEENQFLKNPVYDTEYNIWFDKIPVTAEGADYHYSGRFPNNNIKIQYPGKWGYYIVDSNDDERIYAEGRFIVYESLMPVRSKLNKIRLEGRTIYPANYGQVNKLHVTFDLPDSLHNSQLSQIEVIENHKLDYSIVLDQNTREDNRYFEWDAHNRFSFVIKDLFPGNEYRQCNLRNKNKYQFPKTFAQFDGIETPRSMTYLNDRDFNGGSVIENYNYPNSEYLDVEFRLSLPEDFYEEVFLVGEFTDWNVWPEYKLEKRKGYYSTTVELKRGIYDYQYVTGRTDGDEVADIDWLRIEGNDWRTRNDYYILVFYRTEELGGYDKIIGYSKISGR